MKQTILLVDDEEKILEIVSSYLKSNGYGVVTALTGSDAMNILQNQVISLLVLDLMLPDMDGEEICKAVRRSSDLPIIMMTAKVDEESIINGLKIGADDYITKPFSPRQLVARVEATLRRYNRDDKHILTCNSLSIDTENKTVTLDGNALALTPNEYKILALLMNRPHKIFTRDEIISSIKSDEYDGFDRTIDSHIKNLRQKIEAEPKSPKYVITVYGVGYRMGGDR